MTLKSSKDGTCPDTGELVLEEEKNQKPVGVWLRPVKLVFRKGERLEFIMTVKNQTAKPISIVDLRSRPKFLAEYVDVNINARFPKRAFGNPARGYSYPAAEKSRHYVLLKPGEQVTFELAGFPIMESWPTRRTEESVLMAGNYESHVFYRPDQFFRNKWGHLHANTRFAVAE